MVLAVAQEVVGADIAGFYVHERHGWTAPVYITPGSAWQLLPFERLPTRQAAAGHPGIRHLVADEPDDPFSVTDLVTERTWLECEMARTMRPFWGRQYHFAIPVPPGVAPDGEVDAWVFGRSSARLSAADREVCDAIAPVLTAFARHRTALNRLDMQSGWDLLTQRETLVLKLQAEGVGARGIGARLGMSPRTAQKHAEHIYQKLGVHNRRDAVEACELLGAAQHAADRWPNNKNEAPR
ncbi:response regulator transcription factor [Diaminobutyricibacter sp. McL0618]|uniref:helix-turn-helix transcriptional regulator n=1 Tax=Leifsonia sp. McL0618 TaxID=3415677 RepID=UPI003CF4B876